MLPKVIKGLGLLAALFAAVAAPAISGSAPLSVVGPADSVSCTGGSLRVLGVSFSTTNRSNAAIVCGLAVNQSLSYVSAIGQVRADGVVELSSIRVLSKNGYVPGATNIYLRGPVSAVNSAEGTFVIAGVRIAAPGIVIQVGAEVELSGTQPSMGGVILSDDLRISMDGQDKSSTGSGINSSTGSGKFSSTGSGTQSSTGSGLNSSTGSGKFSSTGSGTQSSTGSGLNSATVQTALSSTGSGVNSSTGSGTLSSVGSTKFSSTGSGRNSSTGSGKFSSTGSGIY